MCGSIDAIASNSVGFLLCNLTADAIAEILPEIQRAMRPQGSRCFQGSSPLKAGTFARSAVPLGLTVLQERTRGEWCALVMRKNGR